MILVTVAQVSFSNMGFVVLLRGTADPRTLPIFIGAPEAQSIAFFLERVEVPRPLTHDLFKQVLDNLECRMKRVEICELRDSTFFAKLHLEADGLESIIDSRPSDAIALALRFAAPIYVTEDVMHAAGILLKDEEASGAESEKKPKKNLSPADALQQQLKKAVEEERYEDAARLRDEIKKLSHTN